MWYKIFELPKSDHPENQGNANFSLQVQLHNLHVLLHS